MNRFYKFFLFALLAIILTPSIGYTAIYDNYIGEGEKLIKNGKEYLFFVIEQTYFPPQGFNLKWGDVVRGNAYVDDFVINEQNCVYKKYPKNYFKEQDLEKNYPGEFHCTVPIRRGNGIV